MLKRVTNLFLIAILFMPVIQVSAISHKPSIDTGELELRIHELINAERRNAGLGPLVLNKKIAVIARRHSLDMARRNYFSHVSPEGEDPLARYKESGFACRVYSGQRIYLGAENIFQNNLYSSVTYMGGRAYYNWNSLDEIARSTVRGWMKSTGHRRNILTPAFRSEGIGVAVKDGRVFITQNFC